MNTVLTNTRFSIITEFVAGLTKTLNAALRGFFATVRTV